MNDPKTEPVNVKPNQQDREREARAARVASALRENLLKRKKQARARTEKPDKS
jgi:hypothetical protein